MPLKRIAPSFVVQLGLPGDSLCPIRILTRKLSRLQVAPTAIARNPVSLASSKRVSDAEHEHSGVLANVASSLKFENAHFASAQITDLTQPMPSVHPALQFAHLELSRLFRASWFFSWFSREMHNTWYASQSAIERTSISLSPTRRKAVRQDYDRPQNLPLRFASIISVAIPCLSEQYDSQAWTAVDPAD